MSENNRYMIVRDSRDGRLFLDFTGTVIRIMFESIVEESNNLRKLRIKYPEAVDLTIDKQG